MSCQSAPALDCHPTVPISAHWCHQPVPISATHQGP
ncbi:unnamed protein product, partial [Staurois parvus]